MGRRNVYLDLKKIILNNCRSFGEIFVIDFMNFYMLFDCNDIF